MMCGRQKEILKNISQIAASATSILEAQTSRGIVVNSKTLDTGAKKRLKLG